MKFGKIDVVRNRALASTLKVGNKLEDIPRYILFSKGEEIDRFPSQKYSQYVTNGWDKVSVSSRILNLIQFM